MAFSFRHGACVAAISLLATAGTAQASQYIVNGDFSSPNTGTGWTNTQVVPGWADLNEASGFLEVGNSSIYGLPCISTGCQNAEVNSNTFGDLVQTVTGLILGHSYTLSFDYGGRPTGGPQAQNVIFGGTQLVTNSGSLGVWTHNSFTFAATAAAETLAFQAINLGGSPSYGNEVTNVSLTDAAVPEPTTWAMMLGGFGMIGFAMRSRATRVRLAYA